MQNKALFEDLTQNIYINLLDNFKILLLTILLFWQLFSRSVRVSQCPACSFLFSRVYFSLRFHCIILFWLSFSRSVFVSRSPTFFLASFFFKSWFLRTLASFFQELISDDSTVLTILLSKRLCFSMYCAFLSSVSFIDRQRRCALINKRRDCYLVVDCILFSRNEQQKII